MVLDMFEFRTSDGILWAPILFTRDDITSKGLERKDGYKPTTTSWVVIPLLCLPSDVNNFLWTHIHLGVSNLVKHVPS